MADKWFKYNSGPATNPASYTEQTGTPSCGGDDLLCAIFAEDDTTGHPVLTQALKDEMLDAIAQGAPDTNVLLIGTRD
ncbi:hypothetical protein [Parapedobacter sp. 2B3]|uniref:hypothetical protein n=1 Tax=Parapedobacter sp. 2B3 TaxID=3342381 RepID=UPI0035B5E2DC